MIMPLHLIELIDLSNKLEDFVIKSTKIFDDSHNHVHMKKVVTNSFEIIDNDEEIRKKILEYPQIIKLVMIVGWLHDVRDHKYPNSITQEELESFIHQVDLDNIDVICKIISNISWSKEARGQRELFEEPYQTVLDIVSDADRLEALGKIGIERCEIFTREHGGSVPIDVIIHCHEKLLRILPEGFIKTSHGKKLAEPLHQEIVDYVGLFSV
jgi:HD superfamily phosphodiesterase